MSNSPGNATAGGGKQELPISCNAWSRAEADNGQKYTFVWTIERFSERREQLGEPILSTEFIAENKDTRLSTKWQLALYPRGCNLLFLNKLSLLLYNRSARAVKATFECSLLDADRQQRNHEKLLLKEFGASGDYFGFYSFAPANLLTNSPELYLPNDSLTIVCDLWINPQDNPCCVM